MYEQAVRDATEQVLLGASLRDLYTGHREGLLRSVDLDPDEADPQAFRADTMRFMARLVRHLGDRHSGDRRVCAALVSWVDIACDYDTYDVLLTGWQVFDGRDRIVRQGQQLFPGPLTAHWSEEGYA